MKKVDDIRASTSGAAPAKFSVAPENCRLAMMRRSYQGSFVMRLSSNWVLTPAQHDFERLHQPSSFIPHIDFQLVPRIWLCLTIVWGQLRRAAVKETGLDNAAPVNNRPVSNLSVVSKLLERVMSSHLASGETPWKTLTLASTSVSIQKGTFSQDYPNERAVRPDQLALLDKEQTWSACIFGFIGSLWYCRPHHLIEVTRNIIRHNRSGFVMD